MPRNNIELSELSTGNKHTPERKETTRMALGRRSKLAFETQTGFHSHWINDVEDGQRLRDAKNIGWVHVNGDDGKPVCKVVDRDKGTKSFLMKISNELWEIIRNQIEEPAKRVDAAIKQEVKELITVDGGVTMSRTYGQNISSTDMGRSQVITNI